MTALTSATCSPHAQDTGDAEEVQENACATRDGEVLHAMCRIAQQDLRETARAISAGAGLNVTGQIGVMRLAILCAAMEYYPWTKKNVMMAMSGCMTDAVFHAQWSAAGTAAGMGARQYAETECEKGMKSAMTATQRGEMDAARSAMWNWAMYARVH